MWLTLERVAICIMLDLPWLRLLPLDILKCLCVPLFCVVCTPSLAALYAFEFVNSV